LTPQKRGPSPSAIPWRKKCRSCSVRMRAQRRSAEAHIIIDVQKKVAALLGHPIPDEIRRRSLDGRGHELATEVGTAPLVMPVRTCGPTTGSTDSLCSDATTPRPLPVGPGPATRDSGHLHGERFQDRRLPRFTRPCSMKAVPLLDRTCTACCTAGPIRNVATSSPSHIRNQNCCDPSILGVDITNSWARQNGLTFTST